MGEPLRESSVVNSSPTSFCFDRTLKPYIVFIWGFFEILFFSGIHYGWHQLLDVFKTMGVFNPPPLFFKTDHQLFELIFQLASAAMAIASLLLGYVLDKMGIRIYKLCGFVLFTTGCLAIACVSGSGPQQPSSSSQHNSQISNESFSASPLSLSLTTAGGVQVRAITYNPIKDMLLLTYGVPAIAVASTVLMLSNFSVGEYFPKWRFIIIAIYSGTYDASSFVFLLLKQLHAWRGVSLNAFMLVLAAAGGVSYLLTSFIFIRAQPIGAKRKQSAEEAPAKPKYACRPIIQLQPPSDAQEEPVRLELAERSSLNSPSASASPSSPTADQLICDSMTPRNEARNELDANLPLVCAAGVGDGDGAAGDCECANNRADALRTSDEGNVEGAQNVQPLMRYLLSPHFLFMCFWTTCMLLRLFNFFAMNFGLVNYWFPVDVTVKAKSESVSGFESSSSSIANDSSAAAAAATGSTAGEEQGKQENPTAALLLKMFSFILFGGILCAPLAGYMIDTLRQRFSRAVAGESERALRVRERLARVQEGAVAFNYNDLFSTVPPLTIATLLCLLVSLLVLVPTATALGIAYVVFTCFRAFLFSTINSYIILCFPSAHTGRLIGAVFFVSGVITLAFGFLQQQLFAWTHAPGHWSGYTTYALLFLVLTAVAFVHPARLVLRRYSHVRRFGRELSARTKSPSPP